MLLGLPVQTDRLRLRRYRTSDVDDIVRYSSHPSVLRVINWKSPDGHVTPDSVREFIVAQNQVEPGGPSWLDLAIALKPHDEVIGTIGIVCKEHRQARIGWALAVDHRGKGLATEAAAAMLDYGFLDLDRHRIDAETTVWNERSWKLMERLGMRLEAHFRESEFARDEWQDVLVYAILRSEWAKARGPQE